MSVVTGWRPSPASSCPSPPSAAAWPHSSGAWSSSRGPPESPRRERRLWPALEVLKLSHCRANAGHFEELAHGIRVGRVPHLRVLNWDDKSCIRKRPVDDVILSALAWGRCPRIESLSFTRNHFCPEHSILYLKDALKACPGLLSLEMDCSRRPCVQLRDLTCALRKGHLPNLVYLFVRATAPYYRGSDVELKALREAAASRGPPVMLLSEIKTRLPPMA